MPLIETGPLRGLYMPDYADGSIVNLLSSIIHGRGGRSPHAPLAGLPPEQLAGADHLVCIAIDGMGCKQLDHYLDAGGDGAFLAAHHRQTISTVFPATTASAITTFLTGATPAEHAILGWHLNLPDLGMSTAVLTSQTRTGLDFAGPDFDLDRYLRLPSHLATVPQHKAQLSYGLIPHSRFSLCSTPWDDVRTFETLDGMVEAVLSVTRAPGPSLNYVYWPVHDSLCHEFGIYHPNTLGHLAEIDTALARLVDGLHGRSVMLLVTADHGIIDTPEAHRVDLSAIPGLYDCFTTLPCGDACHAALFVRPNRVERFERLVAEHLAASSYCLTGEQLLELGVFGPGRPHPALANRLADYYLIARDRHAYDSPPWGRAARFLAGNHGGMSRAEMMVPLYAVEL